VASRPGACRSAIEAEGTDIDLVRRAQDGNERAFESLAEAHHARLFRVAYGILRDRHLAEDATQQALLDIWRYLPRLRDTSKFEAWSYRLLVNACYDEANRRPTWVPTDSMTPGDVPVSRDATGPVIARDQLSRALQGLSMEHRAVLVLRYLMDLSPHEIGVALSIPRRTVYSRLQRAMDSVRGVLEAEARPPEQPPVHQEASR
jgi:RNA polymerase sigma-70 factor (ECF subfamily)